MKMASLIFMTDVLETNVVAPKSRMKGISWRLSSPSLSVLTLMNVSKVADIIHKKYQKPDGYESSPDDSYVNVSDMDPDQSLAFQDSMAKIRRNNKPDSQELMIMAYQQCMC